MGAPDITTAVPQLTFTDNGFVAPAESAILVGVLSDFNSAFGGNLNPALNTPQGQLASSETAIIGDNYDEQALLYNSVDPAYASGRMQDAIGRIYFLTRNPALPTTVQCTLTGLVNTIVPFGAIAQAQDGNLYVNTGTVTIPAGGSVSTTFECVISGPIPCPSGSLNAIYQTIPGWDSITNPADGVLGENVESRADFEFRRQQSVAINADGVLPAIRAAVFAVPGVLDVYTTENDTGSPVTIGGVSIGANSLYVAVSGGAAQAIAQAIWSRKNPGCAYTGNTTKTVQDTSPPYVAPYPSYSVTFETPTSETIVFLVTLANNVNIPSNALALIQNAILAAFSGSDGGSRARIGSTLYASRYYAGIAALGTWVNIIEIQIGTLGTPTCICTGSISTTTLTVTAISSGALAAGQFLFGANVVEGTQIVAQLTGSPGSTGTYSVTTSQTAGSATVDAVAATNNSVAMNINQAPVTAAPNIALVLV